jgi:hypothetical protein
VGVRLTHLPATPERVLQAIVHKREAVRAAAVAVGAETQAQPA